jgi:DNA-binding LacI/PurR family transcriptional regulator
MISLRKLAQQTNVSATTVSLALRDDPSVKPETRQRIQEAARKHNYMPNHLVEGVISGRTKLIAIINSDISTPPQAQLIEHIIDEATMRKWGCLVFNTHNDPEREALCLSQAIGLRVSGMIIATVNYNAEESFFEELYKYRIPFVFSSVFAPEVAVPHIHGDDDITGRQIVDHLYELGHRRIGVVAGPKHSWKNSIRHNSTIKQLSKLVDFDSSYVIPTDWTKESGRQQTHALLEKHPDITALICVTDSVANGAYRTARERSLRIPEDISIVGFGGYPIAEDMMPSLTTIENDKHGIGKKCIDSLLELMDRPEGSPIPRRLLDIRVPGKFVLRESTGPVRPKP